MQISPFSGPGILSGSRLSIKLGRSFGQPEAGNAFLDATRDRQGLLRTTVLLRRAVEKLSDAYGVRGGGTGIPARAESTTSLGLDTEFTAASLTSTEEINTVATSFTPFGPTISGSSTSEATIGGVYTGTVDETLTFTVQSGGTVGSTAIKVNVAGESSPYFEQLQLDGTYVPGSAITLTNGLELSLSAGSLSDGDTFEVQVSATVGSAVDPTKPLNGIRNQNPNLEAGFSVVDGSFLVNGVAVSVFANDTIDDIVAKISASGAGVTATFDSQQERIVLTQDTLGATPTITLSGDTSGFLAATKLASAVVTPGTDDQRAVALENVSQFASMIAGSFNLNGHDITIDPTVDTLNDVIARINSGGVGARAAYDTLSGEFELRSNSSAPKLEVTDGSSKFLSGVLIDDGLYRGEERSTLSSDAARKVSRKLKGLGRLIEDLFTTELSGIAQADLLRVQGLIQQSFSKSIENVFDDGDLGLRTLDRLGLDVDFDGSETDLSFDVAKLAKALTEDGDLLDFLQDGKDESKGLIAGLLNAVEEAQGFIEAKLAPNPSFLNLLA